jgi:ABC-type sugar transport system ATPase subunit
MAHIEIKGLRKSFAKGAANNLIDAIPRIIKPGYAPEGNFTEDGGGARAVDIESLEVADGETLAVIGPSGCGKTTLLKLVAGLEKPDSGSVRFDGEDLTAARPDARRIGMVFQNYALYPHFDAKENIATFFKFRKKSPELEAEKRERMERTAEILGVEIKLLYDRLPASLSGGERQKVALGRCITRYPSLFLMDEPFSNLDAKIRETYRHQLKRLLVDLKVTSIYVTHDQQEAMMIGDRVAVMRKGRVEQTGSFQSLYEDPANLFVAGFISIEPGFPALNESDAEMFLGDRGQGMKIGFRPQEADLLAERPEGRPSVQASVEYDRPLPLAKKRIVAVRRGRDQWVIAAPEGASLRAGASAWVAPKAYFLFGAERGERIRA